MEDGSLPATIEVEVEPPDVAIVTLRREHDISTYDQIAEALERACGHRDVLVDLTECTFIDSSVIRALVAGQRDLAERGGRLEIVLPASASPVINRVFDLMRLREVLTVHEHLHGAQAALESRD